MTHSLLSRSKINASWDKALPKALRYREWHTDRVLYGLAVMLLIAPWIFHVVLDLPNSTSYPYISSIIQGYIVGNQAPPVYYSAVVSGILGLGVMWYDRVRGHLLFVLEGPVQRTDVLRAKVIYGFMAIVAAYTLTMAILGFAASVTHTPLKILGLVAVSGYNILVHFVVFLTALALSAIIGNVLYGGIATAIITSIPVLLSSLVSFFTEPRFPGHPLISLPPHWALSLAMAVSRFSPFAPYHPYRQVFVASPQSATIPYYIAVPLWLAPIVMMWFIGWIVVLYQMALRLWARVPFERFSEPFYFPVLWNGVYALFSFITAWVFNALLWRNQPAARWASVSWASVWVFLACFIVGWWVWREIVGFIGRHSLTTHL